MESSSFSGSLKRAKVPANIAQVVHCLVDGCNADLSRCRDYHRRHKVCEIHSKTPNVSIGGREQRFCQQCSRFHSLVEFDEGKRSCRKRLDGHNRRRRKPQPDSLARNSGLDFSNKQGAAGARLVTFGTPQILPGSVVGLSWGGVVKTENEASVLRNSKQQLLNYMETPTSFPVCPAHTSYKGVNQLQFMQGSACAIQEASICHPFIDQTNAAAAAGSSGCCQKIFSDGALSLLSSVNREFSLNQTLEAEALPQAPSLANNMQYQLAQESNPVASSKDSHGTDASTLHFPAMFQLGAEGSSTTGSHQTLTFMWK